MPWNPQAPRTPPPPPSPPPPSPFHMFQHWTLPDIGGRRDQHPGLLDDV